jgi:hypothetical protein
MRGLPERKGGRKPRFQGLVQGPRATQPSRTHAKQNQICRSSPPEDKHGAPILYSNTNNQPWASCKGGVCPVLHVFLGRVSVPSARTVTATLGCRYPRGEITSNKGADRGLLASFLARDGRRRIIRVIGKNCHCHWHWHAMVGTKKKKKKKKKKAASKSHGSRHCWPSAAPRLLTRSHSGPHFTAHSAVWRSALEDHDRTPGFRFNTALKMMSRLLC